MPTFYPIRPVTGKKFLHKAVLPVVIAWALLFVYTRCYCAFAAASRLADGVCGFGWKAGLFMVANYSFVKLLSLFLGWNLVFQRIGYTFLGYFVTTAGAGFVLLLATFGTPFPDNTTLHFILILLALDTYFGYRDEPDPV